MPGNLSLYLLPQQMAHTHKRNRESPIIVHSSTQATTEEQAAPEVVQPPRPQPAGSIHTHRQHDDSSSPPPDPAPKWPLFNPPYPVTPQQCYVVFFSRPPGRHFQIDSVWWNILDATSRAEEIATIEMGQGYDVISRRILYDFATGERVMQKADSLTLPPKPKGRVRVIVEESAVM